MKKSTLAIIRESAGLTQKSLAEKSGVGQRTIEKIEAGEAELENVTARNASKLSKALGVTVSQLLNGVTAKSGFEQVLKNYTMDCVKFAADSAEWCALDPYNHYTTHSSEWWVETSDNAHGGIDVEWAFHLPKDKIEANAPLKFIEYLQDDITCCIDNGIEPVDILGIIEDFIS